MDNSTQHAVLIAYNHITVILCEIAPFTSLMFCFLASAVLYFYVRKRYLLVRNIRNISDDDLINHCFQNSLKNLKIKVMIANFIVVIVIVEITFNLSFSILNFGCWLRYMFHSDLIEYYRQIEPIFSYIFLIAYHCHIIIPCLLLKVLWLVYLHCPYKHTLLRWTGCIAVRCTVFVVGRYLEDSMQSNELVVIFSCLHTLAFFIDFSLFLVYSRRFYKHLKSREVEARLFKSKQDYMRERAIRRHYRVASILVVIAFFGIAIPQDDIIITILPYIYPHTIIYNYQGGIEGFGYAFYALVVNLNYLYLVAINVGNYLVTKHRQNHINEIIKPVVAKYHDNLHH